MRVSLQQSHDGAPSGLSTSTVHSPMSIAAPTSAGSTANFSGVASGPEYLTR